MNGHTLGFQVPITVIVTYSKELRCTAIMSYLIFGDSCSLYVQFNAVGCHFFYFERFVTVDGIKTSMSLHNLKKYTTYFVWLSASTKVGEGPQSEKHTFSTAEDGACVFCVCLFIANTKK